MTEQRTTAASLDRHHVGSRIEVRTEEETICGVLVSLRRRHGTGQVTVRLTDGSEPLVLDASHPVHISTAAGVQALTELRRVVGEWKHQDATSFLARPLLNG